MKLLAVILITMPLAVLAEPVRFNAHANPNGTMFVELTDEATGAHMSTTLTPERTKNFEAWVTRRSGVATKQAAPMSRPAELPSCGFTDFVSGKC